MQEEKERMDGNGQILIGWGSCSITPERPVFLAGQMYYRISRYVHDPITATALVLDNGNAHTILLSCDMVGVSDALCGRIRAELDGFEGIDASNLSVSVTHTHNSCLFSPDFVRSGFEAYFGRDISQKMDVPGDVLEGDEAVEFYLSRVIPMVRDAWRNRKPGFVSSAAEYAPVGFNRRPVFSLGGGAEESRMYGDCSQPNFLRFEGTSDHTVDMVYTFDSGRNLTGVLVNVPCPSQVFELHYFISADYWHYARGSIRHSVGENVYVLPLCGASGDQNPLDLVRLSKMNSAALKDWNAQAGEAHRNLDMTQEAADIGERIAFAAARGLRKSRSNMQSRPVFSHKSLMMELPLRQVSEAEYRASKQTLDAHAARFSPENRMTSADQVAMFNDIGVVNRWNLQNQTQAYRFQVNLTRLGETALITNPFEMFCEYGLRIRARAKPRQIINAQLTNGTGGYLPTTAAVRGGSYSAKPASTKVGPEGGDLLVEAYIREIDSFW